MPCLEITMPAANTEIRDDLARRLTAAFTEATTRARPSHDQQFQVSRQPKKGTPSLMGSLTSSQSVKQRAESLLVSQRTPAQTTVRMHCPLHASTGSHTQFNQSNLLWIQWTEDPACLPRASSDFHFGPFLCRSPGALALVGCMFS